MRRSTAEIRDPWSHAQRAPDQIAVVAEGRRHAFAELVDRAATVQQRLWAVHGIEQGACVASISEPSFQFFALHLALLDAGVDILPLDPGSGGKQIEQLLAAAGAHAVAVSGAYATTLRVRAPACPQLDLEQLAAPPSGTAQAVRRSGTTAGRTMLATSGTTGPPKLVMPMRPCRAYRGVAVLPERADSLHVGPHVMCGPTFHRGSLGPATTALHGGETVVVLDRWDPIAFARLVVAEAAATTFLTPPQLADLLRTRSREVQVACARLRVVLHGAGRCPTGLKRQFIEWTRTRVVEHYAATEGLISEATDVEWLRRPGTVGRPLPGVAVEIRSALGEPVPAGVVGDVHVRFRAVDSFAAEGAQGDVSGSRRAFVKLGDVGYIDADGWLFVLGRQLASDAAEPGSVVLEDAVRGLPGVADALVVSVDDGLGSRSCVLVVEPLAEQTSELARLVADAVEAEGQIRVATTVFVERIPRNASGKVDLHGLLPKAGSHQA